MRFFTTYSWTWDILPITLCWKNLWCRNKKFIVQDYSVWSFLLPVFVVVVEPRSRDGTRSQSGGRTCRWMDVRRQVYTVSCMLGSHAVRPCVRARTRPVHTATRRISSARQSHSHFALYRGTHASQCVFADSVICAERSTLQTGQDPTHNTTSHRWALHPAFLGSHVQSSGKDLKHYFLKLASLL